MQWFFIQPSINKARKKLGLLLIPLWSSLPFITNGIRNWGTGTKNKGTEERGIELTKWNSDLICYSFRCGPWKNNSIIWWIQLGKRTPSNRTSLSVSEMCTAYCLQYLESTGYGIMGTLLATKAKFSLLTPLPDSQRHKLYIPRRLLGYSYRHMCTLSPTGVSSNTLASKGWLNGGGSL